MKTSKILISALVGTTAMTLFSYLISKSKNKKFQEPEILAQLIERLPIKYSQPPSNIMGWGIHYIIGILFVAIFCGIWEQTKMKPSHKTGAIFGLLSGLAGVVGWQILFGKHPNPPAKNLKQYYRHLILAHIVFGTFSTVTYKALSYKPLADKNRE